MAEKRTKRPRDTVELAKLIGDIATGQKPDTFDDGKNPNKVAAGKAGGAKGGKARAEILSKKRRLKIAKKAAETRWAKNPA